MLHTSIIFQNAITQDVYNSSIFHDVHVKEISCILDRLCFDLYTLDIYYCRPRYQSENFLSVCGVKPTYVNWARGEPNDVGGKEGCAYLKTSGVQQGKWNDAKCSSVSFHYICEFNYLRCK